MNHICPAQGHPCQHPMLCDGYCDINTAEVETPYTGPSRLHRALDWVGNLPHRFGRWVDRTNAGRLFCVSVGAVLAGGMAVSVLVGFAK